MLKFGVAGAEDAWQVLRVCAGHCWGTLLGNTAGHNNERHQATGMCRNTLVWIIGEKSDTGNRLDGTDLHASSHLYLKQLLTLRSFLEKISNLRPI